MITAKDLIDKGLTYIGVKEKPAGSNNVIFNTHYYGREINGARYAWCAVFIWDLCRMLGAPELYYGGGKTASCTTLWKYMRGKGQEVTGGELKPGDWVFFKFNYRDGKAHHIGLLTETDGKRLGAVLEGNTSKSSDDNGGAVMLRRDRKMSQVIAVCRPAYGEKRRDKEMEYKEFKEHMQRFLDEQAQETLPQWAKGELEEAKEAGITDGTAPMSFIPRYQAAIMAKRAAKHE